MKRFLFALAAALGIASAAAAGASGCSSDLTETTPGHDECDASHQCAGGFACDVATNTCRPNGSPTSSSTTTTSTSSGSAGGSGGAGGGCANPGADGGCACADGETSCGGHCVSTQNDPESCGACGATCTAPPGGKATCTLGVCGFSCPNGKACGASCADTTSDRDNCGDCGDACPAPLSGTGAAACTSGACGVTCTAPTTRCTTTAGDTCVNMKTDPQFCGSCGKQCAGGQTCSNGSCVNACSPGLTGCSGKCVDEANNGNDCGACGNACDGALGGSHKYCQNGACATACAGGLTACGLGVLGAAPFTCANLQKDASNCGACGTACATGQICDAGHCVSYIPASGCWECGDGNTMPLCCTVAGQTVCTGASACP